MHANHHVGRLDHGNGGFVHLVKRTIETVRNHVPAIIHRKRVGIAHGLNAARGHHGGSGENGKNFLLHRNHNQPGNGAQVKLVSRWLPILDWVRSVSRLGLRLHLQQLLVAFLRVQQSLGLLRRQLAGLDRLAFLLLFVRFLVIFLLCG